MKLVGYSEVGRAGEEVGWKWWGGSRGGRRKLTSSDGGWVFALHGRDAESFAGALRIVARQDWGMDLMEFLILIASS